MDSKNTPVRVKSGGTQISRRTVARGVAWSAPIAVVATAAPAFATSPGCQPVLTFSNDSCKCPGQSADTQEFVYFVKFCVTDNASCPTPSGSTSTFVITSVAKDNPGEFVLEPDACFPSTLPSPATPLGSCTTQTYRFRSSNSANHLIVGYSVTIVNSASGVSTTTDYTVTVDAPPKCTGTLDTQRCTACTP